MQVKYITVNAICSFIEAFNWITVVSQMQEKVSLPENTKRRSRLTKQSHSENRQKHDDWNPASRWSQKKVTNLEGEAPF